MAQVKVTIDGQPVTADSSLTILDAARSLGKEIPTLCHDPRLEPFTSCFVCVVEVDGARGYVPSCATKLTDKMVIRTDTPEIRQARKMALELIVSNHFADCLGPCELTCPANVDVQGYIALLALGKYREAVALIKETNPFPSVCGRVCTRPCEGKCRRAVTDQPVGIDYLKRYATDLDRECSHPFTPEKRPPTGRRVAVVGGGPAGLSAAYYLALEGHQVQVFEANEQPGGWLRYGIPEYRLPEDVLDYEIDSIRNLGVNVKTGRRLGLDITLEGLFDDGYEAVFLGIGAWGSTLMNIPDEDAGGVMSGIGFLEKVNKGAINEMKGRVVVIGGGNTAVDAARTSLRLGADTVTLVYRRSRAEMPAHHLEIEEMEHEGVVFSLLTNPVRFLKDEQGRVRGVACVRMALGEPDASGRRRPVPVEGSDFELPADWVFEAIGQQADVDFLTGSGFRTELKTTRWGSIEVDPETMATTVPGIFAGGDMVTGAATAIEAIAAGKKAAGAIHYYLSGRIIPSLQKPFLSRKENLKPVLSAEDFTAPAPSARQSMPSIPVEDRLQGFLEVELGYTPDQAQAEIQRCLECGCTAFFECDLQRHCTAYDVEQRAFPGEFLNTGPDKSHPFLRMDMNKCILCGRCVRICDEVVGATALGFTGRGFDARVRPALDKPLLQTTCVSCGQCADTCPTGAITVKPDAPKPGPFKLGGVPSVCGFCSVGCGIVMESLGDRVIRVSSNRAAPVNDGGNLCKSGRFGFRAVNGADRLTRPLIRRDGRLLESSWPEAIAVIGEKIRLNLEEFGAGSLAVLAGSGLTNEEAYLLQKLARGVWKTPNIYNLALNGKVAAGQFAAAQPNVDYGRLSRAEFILVLGLNTLRAYPILDFKLQKAARSGKTEVVYLHREQTFLSGRAQRWVPLAPENVGTLSRALLAGVLARLTPSESMAGLDELRRHLEGIHPEEVFRKIGLGQPDAAHIIDSLLTRRCLVVFDLETAGAETGAYWQSLAALLSEQGRTLGLLPMLGRSNSRGTLEMGLHPSFLPGGQSTTDPEARELFRLAWNERLPQRAGHDAETLFNLLHNGQIRSLVVYGEDLAGGAPESSLLNELRGLDFLVVADLYLTRTAELAHVVLPAASFVEKEGTMINAERRLQHLRPAIAPLAGKSGLEALADLAREWDTELMPGGLPALWKEMEGVIPSLKGHAIATLGVEGVVLANCHGPAALMVPPPRSGAGDPRLHPGGDAMLRRWRRILREAGIADS